jgi:hypothetical protein
MKNTVTSKVIGQLTQDKDFADWWKSEDISVPFFDGKKMPVTFMNYAPDSDQQFLEKADEALRNFLKLGKRYRQEVSKHVYKNCIDFLEDVGYDEVDETLRDMKDENEIWKFVHPSEIYVSRRPYKEHDIYVQIACSCDWEQEHGLQLVFRQGLKLTRVSDQDGHVTEADAYGKPDEEDELLSAFNSN